MNMKKIALLIAFSALVFSIQAKPRFITYEQYGAKGDGVTDDMPAIVAADKTVAHDIPRFYFITNERITIQH